MLMASCRHGVVLGAANMERGETYRHVHFLHSKLPSKFFCQDVVCHYWPFAHDVGLKLPQYSKLTSECSPLLSRWHGKTHSWPCQVNFLCRFCKKHKFNTFSIRSYGPATGRKGRQQPSERNRNKYFLPCLATEVVLNT